ncbi:MAG: pyruvate kinase [Acidobacteria bacterium]|nr:pyruvate kinase [Acidobacteriota bacterium]
MRHTKIIATVGPASQSDTTLAELVEAGVDVFRLNFSHGTQQTHADVFARVRHAARGARRHVAIMQDLAGPKIRTGRLTGGGPVALEEGATLRIEIGEGEGSASRVFSAYAPLAAAVRRGDRLLLDDGRIELQVAGADGQGIDTLVVNGGPLGERKGIAAPGVPLPSSALTEKDVSDLRFGLELGVDLVAISFVQTADDIRAARDVMRRVGREASVIAKIERASAVDHIDAILQEADGVMVARGDLGLELPFERVPTVQKAIARRARERGLPAIVATQVLESMRFEPRPTRAEVSDAANAVEEGVDAIMLAGETAAGQFPVRAVRALDAVLREAERMLPDATTVEPSVDPTRTGHGRALCEAAVTLARTGQADAIVAVTRGGKTARLLSALRPKAPIYAATDSIAVAERLALQWGVVPIVCALGSEQEVERSIVACGAIQGEAVVVLVSVSPNLRQPHSNFLTLRRV